ncbi:MAG: ACP S-malonyltransferase [Fimbriimonadaceae bacterium]|nr:ACP S-malonyltransferase [Fimbriimonadaceae bacterium]
MIAALFPGQGSQAPGMGKSFFDHSAASRDVFQRISETVGRNLQEICFEFDEETLRQTDNAQIALFTVSLAAYAAYQTSGKSADLYAGHSIGEYAALVASGCIPLAVGAKLVQKRGELMAAAKSGGMAAVLGLDIPAIEEALKQVEGTVVVANDNCPGQVVISGDATAVIEAVPVLQSAGAKRVLPLNVSGAFHSPLMQDAADEFALSLAQVEFSAGRVVSNVTASEVTDAN